ncbi:IPF1 [Biomphalaria pfeifferi]|uniref:IPF1 n=1 Tax=Biomphalaria pfeifferi TaxID=112525 RepID=A0AAD8FFU1_BIOPF|nr:IPF1 [Biomphalaria pfeifferi]
MSITMDGHARFYPAFMYPREFGGSVDGSGHHSHALISGQPPACYYAYAQEHGGYGGQAMSVVEQEQHQQQLDSVHPTFASNHQQHSGMGHHQSRCYSRGLDGSHSASGRLHHPCSHGSIQQAHHHSPSQHIPGAHLQHPSNVEPGPHEAAHKGVPASIDPISATPAPAHHSSASVMPGPHLDHHGLAMHMNDPPPAHSQNACPISPTASLSDSDIHHQHQHSQTLPFPWMKTTKSHAHQWKAHWPGKESFI